MEIGIFGLSHHPVAEVADSLRRAGHLPQGRSAKYWDRAQYERFDAVLVFGCAHQRTILDTYLARNVPAYGVAEQNPIGTLGYPMADLGNGEFPARIDWGFLKQPNPPVADQPDGHRMVWGVPRYADIEKLEAPPLPRHETVSRILAPDAFAAARRVVVVGGGPSLRGFDWNLLRGEVVIGANRAYQQPHVGTFVTVDDRFVKWARSGQIGADDAERAETARQWAEFPGLKVFSPNPGVQFEFPDCCWLERTPIKTYPPTLHSIGIATNSGLAGIMLAWALGAREICLLGFDMGATSGSRQSWYHTGYPERHPTREIFPRYIPEFDHVAPLLKRHGVKVTLYGPSTLTHFDKQPLGQFRKRVRYKPDWPLVVGYYTEGTPYEAEAREMQRTARVFGLETALYGVPNLRDWHANTQQKAEVVERALREHDRPILYLDADARIRRYPALMSGFLKQHDVGLGWIDWAKLPGRRTDRELLNACMVWKPTPKAFALLSAWKAVMRERQGRGELEQLHLDMALQRVKGLKVREIPMEYNQIHDLMAAHSDKPVIHQMQASRRLRDKVAR